MKKWTRKYTDWLIAHADAQDIKGLFAQFCSEFPEIKTTLSGMKNARYVLGIRAKPGTGKGRHVPVFTEHKKKGYWQIKVAEPNIWQQKQNYVYEQYYHVKLEKWTNVFFLDLNRDNFDINNLYPVSKHVVGILNCSFPLVPGDPEGNLTRIKQAELKYQIHQLGRKVGLCSSYGVFKSKVLEKRREYLANMTPEQKERAKATRQRYFEKARQDPVWREKRRAYCREWYKKQQAKKKAERCSK